MSLTTFAWPLQPLNQVIIWDKIVKSADEAVLKYTNEFVKYALIDQGSELRYIFDMDIYDVLNILNEDVWSIPLYICTKLTSIVSENTFP